MQMESIASHTFDEHIFLFLFSTERAESIVVGREKKKRTHKMQSIDEILSFSFVSFDSFGFRLIARMVVCMFAMVRRMKETTKKKKNLTKNVQSSPFACVLSDF